MVEALFSLCSQTSQAAESPADTGTSQFLIYQVCGRDHGCVFLVYLQQGLVMQVVLGCTRTLVRVAALRSNGVLFFFFNFSDLARGGHREQLVCEKLGLSFILGGTMAVTQRCSCDSRRKGLIVWGWLMLHSALASRPTELLRRPKETDTLEPERQRKEVKAFHS